MTLQLAIEHAARTSAADPAAMIGGWLAIVAAIELGLVTKAVGPQMRGFPCLPAWLRFLSGLTATAHFARGVMVLTTLGGTDARHPHWDMPVGWGFQSALMLGVLFYVLGQRMDPAVRARLDARDQHRRNRVREILKRDPTATAEAKLVASGSDAMAAMSQLGLSPETARKLSEMG